MSTFFNIIAWALGIASTLLLILRILCFWTYSDLEAAKDSLRGVRRVFPMKWPAMLALICWAWIIAKPF